MGERILHLESAAPGSDCDAHICSGITLGKLLDCSWPKCPQVTLTSTEVLCCTSGFKDGKLANGNHPRGPEVYRLLRREDKKTDRWSQEQ